MLLLHGQDLLQHAPRRRVAGTEPGDDLAVGRDGHAFGDQVLAEHRGEFGRVVFGVAPTRQRVRIEVGLSRSWVIRAAIMSAWPSSSVACRRNSAAAAGR